MLIRRVEYKGMEIKACGGVFKLLDKLLIQLLLVSYRFPRVGSCAVCAESTGLLPLWRSLGKVS